MLPPTIIEEDLISVTSIKTLKTMKAGRMPGTFGRERQLHHEHETGGCRRSGRRFGAGRKRGCGKWGEETVVMRIPKSQVELVKAFLENIKPIEMI